ncbi:hypothetical protein EBR56_02875 [bacterium]|nr:hypothetical protein [bacterium]
MFTSLSLFAVFKFLKRSGWPALVLAPALALLTTAPSSGDIIYTGSSVVFNGANAAGLSARATFSVDPGDSNVLRLLLENTSASPTTAPSELLTSVYFNVLSGTVTGSPAPLTYQSASGQVYLALQSMPDKAATYVPPPPPGGTVTFPAIPTPSNLKAANPGDNTWQFRDGMSLVASEPPLAFGVSTVGNSTLAPNNFNGNIVDGFDFGIYVGDVTTQNLDDRLLVGGSANFAFAGFGGFDLSKISPHAVFGFGTSPDCIITVPEPHAIVIATLGLCLCSLWQLSRRRGSPAAA